MRKRPKSSSDEMKLNFTVHECGYQAENEQDGMDECSFTIQG